MYLGTEDMPRYDVFFLTLLCLAKRSLVNISHTSVYVLWSYQLDVAISSSLKVFSFEEQ